MMGVAGEVDIMGAVEEVMAVAVVAEDQAMRLELSQLTLKVTRAAMAM